MSYFMGFFLILLIVASAGWALLTIPPARLANIVRLIGPVALCFFGGVLTIGGRGAIGLPLVALGASLWLRARSVRRMSGIGSGGGNSTVRSAWLEMRLDHATGEMDGLVLTGNYDGSQLSEMSEPDLMDLYESVSNDADSGALLEAYFDRRFPGWRENTQTDFGSRSTGSSSSGPMDKEEAYQILGLAPGANADAIREAHRRLMKRIHPDSGGSTFLATKINQAKEVLLD